jgi:3-(3-hydroxy-phenyl)propionate hydroxylase
MGTYTYEHFPYRRVPELATGRGSRRQVVIVGAGPVGLSAAIDLAMQGIPSVIVDDNDVVSIGSRAICWAKRTLEIFDRLGVGDRMVAKGVTWKIGRVFHRDRELYRFDLLPESGHKMPAFINLQQYYVEQYLVERALEFPDLIDLRWKNRVIGVKQTADGVETEIETPDGRYRLVSDWLIAADGVKSTVRAALGLPFEGHTFEEKFLIVDVRINADYPSDRRFWFQPVFDRGQSVLIHRQPDAVFRIDFQLGLDADAEAERQPDKVMERVRAVVGPGVDCALEWCSVYTFRCARIPRFVAGRVVFVGDSAHVVSPFGARGGNGGIQDADNLCWKLARVLRGEAPPALIGTYNAERIHGADENLTNSSRTTTFMTPKSAAEQELRDGVLALAPAHPFARALVNSGRLSKPCNLHGFPGFVPDDGSVPGPMLPGTPCADAPICDAAGRAGWLLDALGSRPTALVFIETQAEAAHVAGSSTATGIRDLQVFAVTGRVLPDLGLTQLMDCDDLVRARYGGSRGVTYLIRPDQHVLGRWARWDPVLLGAAWQQCLSGSGP